jgi:thioredoxin 1
MKLIDFYATWCGPCKAMMPTINRLSETALFEVEKIDVDENPDMASKYGIRGIPTLVFVNDAGEILWRKSGVHTEQQILSAFNELSQSQTSN